MPATLRRPTDTGSGEPEVEVENASEIEAWEEERALEGLAEDDVVLRRRAAPADGNASQGAPAEEEP